MASLLPTRSEPPNDLPMTEFEEKDPIRAEFFSVIDSFRSHVSAQRIVLIEKRIEENRQKLISTTNSLYKLSEERRNVKSNNAGPSTDLLSKRQKDAIDMHNNVDMNNDDDNSNSSHDEGNASSAVLLGSSIAVKNAVRPIKLGEVKKLPPYTTWIFLDRNQRMTEDQSVLGRRRIYYDQSGGEALICSDSEEEVIDDEEEKIVFLEAEDYILRFRVRYIRPQHGQLREDSFRISKYIKTINQVGSSDIVLQSLAQCTSKKPCEVKARYEFLIKGEKIVDDTSDILNSFHNKDLDAALDSFDNLFCRRCLVFDCKLHGCSQDLVFPVEKQPPWSHPDNENSPCGHKCYQLALKLEKITIMGSPHNGHDDKRILPPDPTQTDSKKKLAPSIRRVKSSQSESALSNSVAKSESSDSESRQGQGSTRGNLSSSPSENKLAVKRGVSKRNNKRVAERAIFSMRKRQKNTVASDTDSIASQGFSPGDTLQLTVPKESEGDTPFQTLAELQVSVRSRRKEPSVKDSTEGSSYEINLPESGNDASTRKEEFMDENICKEEPISEKSWKPIEKGLFEKGVEIFGKNSCLIAKNLLTGMKTCSEVYWYMKYLDKQSCRDGYGLNSLTEGHSKGDLNETTGNGMRRRSKFLRRRGKVRRLKYSSKSAAYHSLRKRISEKKDQPCRQYNPCNCQTACGKDCPCHLNETCCEKYCGCIKTCKNRFRGCHCAKSQCCSKKCPCFAADRECDPDVCRNCWVSCGDGSLGGPFQKGENNECRNMMLLLKQQQRVLLGRSDVSGWGAFLKNSVGKHEYLGEYTGELISHREADKRGKIYDRENSSFLFNLNDQFVLDAFRKGDKLKFANHSPDPNCYAKVIMVAGDHRVGIFAKERIGGGEELFYDYRYEADRAPAWARKPDAPGSKKDDTAPSSGRAKKLA